MDLGDEKLMEEWEDDSSFVDFDVLSALEASGDGFKPQLSEKGEKFLNQMDEDLDYAFALSLQTQYDEEIKENAYTNLKGKIFSKHVNGDLDYALSLQTQYDEEVKGNAKTNLKKPGTSIASGSKPLSIIDDQWELIDPHPDIHALFIEFDVKFFYGKLKGVEVRWSPRMTLCAGVCCYEGRGGLCSVRLSLPLLKLRPRKDLVETLLHEMIHAYLFVTHNNKDREGHGPEFLSHMYRINKETGTKISVYHSFHNEVDLYRQHWWKCDGPCQKRRPFFGLVKRAMNRAPGPKDPWYQVHQTSCGGKFIKIKEPDSYNKKKPTKRKLLSASDNNESCSDIRNFMKGNSSSSDKLGSCKSTKKDDDSSLSDKCANSKSTARSLKDGILSSGKCDGIQSTFKSSNIYDFNSLLSKEDNMVSLNQNGISEKKKFIPFKGTGFKLGGTSEKSVLSSTFSSYHKKSDSSFSGKSLLSSNFGFSHKKPNMPSSSSEKMLDISHSTSAKLPRISHSSNAGNVQKDHLHDNLNKSPKKLIQSPLEKFLSPKIESGNSRATPKKIEFINLCESPGEVCTSKVPCPVCSALVKEENINSHLDSCLS